MSFTDNLLRTQSLLLLCYYTDSLSAWGTGADRCVALTGDHVGVGRRTGRLEAGGVLGQTIDQRVVGHSPHRTETTNTTSAQATDRTVGSTVPATIITVRCVASRLTFIAFVYALNCVLQLIQYILLNQL